MYYIIKHNHMQFLSMVQRDEAMPQCACCPEGIPAQKCVQWHPHSIIRKRVSCLVSARKNLSLVKRVRLWGARLRDAAAWEGTDPSTSISASGRYLEHNKGANHWPCNDAEAIIDGTNRADGACGLSLQCEHCLLARGVVCAVLLLHEIALSVERVRRECRLEGPKHCLFGQVG